MPYVERDTNGIVKGLYANPQPGYAEEWIEDDDTEVIAFLNPTTPPDPPHLNHGGLVRFTGLAPSTVLEGIRMLGATRIAKGRYRGAHEAAMPSDQYSVITSILDTRPLTARVTSRTADYVEVRVTDLEGVAQDPTEVTIKSERVIYP